MKSLPIRVALLALGACLVTAPGAAAGNATEMSATIYVGGLPDLRPGPGGASRCSALVDRAAAGAYGMQRLQFLVSVWWVDTGPRNPPPGWSGCDHYSFSDYYCFNRFNSTSVDYWSYERGAGGKPVPVDQAQVNEFSRLLGQCFQQAVDQGFDVAVNVHADDGNQKNGWRNTLDFDPLQPFRGFTYMQVFLDPVVDALAAAMGARSEAYLALQGEMGATVFIYPDEWAQVADAVRERFAAMRPELRGRLKLGLGINNSKLCGCILIDVLDYNEYLSKFAPLWLQNAGMFDLPAIHELFGNVDFVGISAYIPQKRLDFQPCDMETLMRQMDREFAFYNLTLRKLADEGKEIHWIEFGIGGGDSQNGDRIATDPLQAAYYPYFGIGGRYTRALDPWTTYAPEQPNAVRDYMHHYYNATSQYLLQGGCDFRVDAVYMWNLGSWDVIGLYPDGSAEGSYRDVGAVDIVIRHNARANAG